MAPRYRHANLLLLFAMLLMTILQPRPLAAQGPTFTVNSLLDTNVCDATTCTLRGALTQATAGSTIRFSVSGEIALSGILPALSVGGVTIDATSAAAPYNPTIFINAAGIATGGMTYGLQITSDNNVIRGLGIIRVPMGAGSTDDVGAGIIIDRGSNNAIYNCWIGLAANGTNAAGNAGYGILIKNGASNNIIGANSDRDRNVISANLQGSIGLIGQTFDPVRYNTGNRIEGNYIGPNAVANAKPLSADTEGAVAGIHVRAATNDTTISNNVIGTFISERSGIIAAGIAVGSHGTVTLISDLIPNNTRIVGNHIGVSPSGVALSNRIGIAIGEAGAYGPRNTFIGDPLVAGSGNVIAGNTRNGIYLEDTSFAWGDVTIAGNRLGMTSGGALLGNATGGEPGSATIYVGRNQPTNPAVTPGRATIGPGNIVAASGLYGIRVRSGGHTIKGNLIGTNANGTASTLPGTAHQAASIFLEHGTGVTVGGPNSAERNIIAFSNSLAGGGSFAILVNPGAANLSGCAGTCTTGGHIIEGNYIGVSANGAGRLNTPTSSRDGILLARTTNNTIRNNLIGGLAIGIRIGLSATNYNANSNLIIDNKIGAPVSGEIAFTSIPSAAQLASAPRNLQEGIKIVHGNENRIENNLIAYNGSGAGGSLVYPGVRVGDNSITGAGNTTAAGNNRIIGNRLVRNSDHTTAATSSGVFVDTATRVLISRNTTQFHHGDGIFLFFNGNANRAAPTSLTFTATTPGVQLARIQGSATDCGAGCTVEIFTSNLSTETREGPVYVTSGTTGTGGAFAIDLPFCQEYLTATVTDSNNNTSPYSNQIGPFAAGSCTPATFNLTQANPNQQSLLAGTTYTYTHRLAHTAQVALTYNIQIASDLGWARGPLQVTVPAGGTVDVPVVVSVPAAATEGQRDTTTIRATLGNVASNQISNITTARLPQGPTPTLNGPFNLNQGATQTTFNYTLTNAGDQPGSFVVNPPTFSSTPPSGWSFQQPLTALNFNLAAGASANFAIVINTPGSPPADSFGFSFVASTQGLTPNRTVTRNDTVEVPVIR
ncbi:MAG: hypothetical protein EI684_05715, partial [Candidatus Viridilinea halotolerans]